MIANANPEVAVPARDKTSVSRILRWAARITSLPAIAMVLTSLLPALANFSISAKDDKIIALGLMGVFIGNLVGWRWATLGGGIVVGGVVAILTQGDGLLSPDPFSVAFGLQGILFLISGLLNAIPNNSSAAAPRWARQIGIALLALCAAAGATSIYRGPGPTPVPKDKESFVGLWQNGKGFTMEISPDGRTKVTADKDSKIDSCNNPLGEGAKGDFQACFQAGEKLELTTGLFGKTKLYHIDRYPHPEGNQIKMVLNGSDPYNKRGGMVLVKRP
jgi:hypothetical protein